MRKTITFDPKGNKEAYEKAAKDAGMRLGEWVRSCCDGCLDKRPRVVSNEGLSGVLAGNPPETQVHILSEPLPVRAVDPMEPKFVRRPVGKIAKMMEKKP